jgi:hypothetical protein
MSVLVWNFDKHQTNLTIFYELANLIKHPNQLSKLKRKSERESERKSNTVESNQSSFQLLPIFFLQFHQKHTSKHKTSTPDSSNFLPGSLKLHLPTFHCNHATSLGNISATQMTRLHACQALPKGEIIVFWLSYTLKLMFGVVYVLIKICVLLMCAWFNSHFLSSTKDFLGKWPWSQQFV